MLELAFVAAWCTGYTNVPLSDRTRVDCLTETHAWEVDRGENWAEAVGQALHYGRMTGKHPAILLRDPTSAQAARLELVIQAYGLPIHVEHHYGAVVTQD